uniref:Uncharacterized protein n=1 Tax=Picocystis salinarum TaxID=88271 RepID=A0A7S3XAX5_9CHLO|mmetsp:Transcript_4020/g.25265  ORF Transcript_4020/g.25265 Transcript_4020/m.25265 type:complete len:520 (-) Transcript_4020:255-1814(-)|eukprot:CAMPEP_0183830630 /NCGR_PEP_ID=MMETSP0807_2-20130328/4132_1 /TAXON_ID=88271 /ORGANISM="Picocystis salinarum, Strain CCMP1897" /LENGTH=519 /DNA_ID=CAMNT_0026076007 /DNA_START=214 /DNA_END=1773 /DNA_ORIENTATION=-
MRKNTHVMADPSCMDGRGHMWLVLFLTAPMMRKTARAQDPLPAPNNAVRSGTENGPASPFWSANLTKVNAFFADAFNTDVVIEADLWDVNPKILSAGLGFLDIIGIDVTDEETVRAGGGTWEANVTCANGEDPPLGALTSATSRMVNLAGYNCIASGYGGLPICFSWPVRPPTIRTSAFRVTFNNGSTVHPPCAGIMPNVEYNERHCVVIFGDFGTRSPSTDPLAIYPVKVEVVQDLQLIGPDGPVSANGLSFEGGGSPYDAGNGPYFTAAKLNRLSDVGEGVFTPSFINTDAYPNSGVALYGNGGSFYRIRLFYSGGMTPNGVKGLQPVDFAKYFYLAAMLSNGNQLNITEPGELYDVGVGTLSVLGLADTGPLQAQYDACYIEDRDNYIDIIIDASNEAAASTIVSVQAFQEGYESLYNPGGPGNDPTPGVLYTSSASTQSVGVTNAIEFPRTVTYCTDANSRVSTNPEVCSKVYGPNGGEIPHESNVSRRILCASLLWTSLVGLLHVIVPADGAIV